MLDVSNCTFHSSGNVMTLKFLGDTPEAVYRHLIGVAASQNDFEIVVYLYNERKKNGYLPTVCVRVHGPARSAHQAIR